MTGDVVPRNLPRAVRGFVNRSLQLRQLDELTGAEATQGTCPIAVVSGTAGVGKTAFAVQWGHSAAARYPDGQLYFDMRGFGDRDPVSAAYALGALLGRLGVNASDIPVELEDRAALYQSLMSGTRRILCLDNVHAIKQIRPLLPAAGGCVVLVTTRGELSGLSLLEGAYKVRLDVLPEAEAVDLLRRAADDREVADAPEDWIRLARLCGYLPLALRIAGQRLADRPHTPVSEVVEALRDESERLDALRDVDGDVSVRAVFDWSYRELPETAATLFRRLGAHPGEHFTAEAGAVLSGTPHAQVLASFETLVRAHLLERLDRNRFAVHDLLRAYAVDLIRSTEEDAWSHDATARLATWYQRSIAAASAAMGCDSLGMAEGHAADAGGEHMRFAGHGQARTWFESEQSNAPAVVLTAARLGEHETTWRLAASLLGIYEVDNSFDDWFATSESGLASARECSNAYGEAVMHESLGKAYRQSHQFVAAERHQLEALRIRETIRDAAGVIRSVNALGLIYRRTGRYDQARKSFQRVADASRADYDRIWLALALLNLGGLDAETGAYETARSSLLEAIPLLDETGQHVYSVNALKDLGAAYRGLGEAYAALEAVSRAIELARSLGNEVFLAEALLERARVHHSAAALDKAVADYDEVVSTQRRLGDKGREAIALDELGSIHLELGRPDQAVAYHEAAERIHREFGDARREAIAAEHRAAAERALRQPGQEGHAV